MLFRSALATVILPTLSRQVASSEQTAYSRTLDWALRLVFLVALPATAALAILAFPLMVTLFHYGQFSATDASMASKSLIAFALGLTGFILVKVLAPGFYARKDTRTPAIIGAIAMGVNALVAVSLVFVFTLGHVGLALATSLAGIVNAVLLYIRLVSKTGFQPGDGWPAFLARVSLATLIMAALLAFGVAGDLAWLSHSVPKRILLLGFWVIAGGGVYLGSLYLLGLKVHRFVERP